MSGRRSALLTGALLGAAAALWLGARRRRRWGGALFSPVAARRRMALTALAGRRDADTARLLREYLRWEPEAALRRRGATVLARLERAVEGGGQG